MLILVRAKARLITEMVETPEKMAQEKQQYRSVREHMGRPGIVDLATGNSAATNARLTFDLSSTGRPRMSNSGVPSGGNSNGSNSSTGGGSGSQNGNIGSYTSPRSSLDSWSQQSSSAAYRQQKGRAPPKKSMEGRYSLSLPLHSIQEETHYTSSGAPSPNPFQPSNPIQIPNINNNNNTLNSSITPINTPHRSQSLGAKKSMPTIKVNTNNLGSSAPGSASAFAKPTGNNEVINLNSPISSNNPFLNMTSNNNANILSSTPPHIGNTPPSSYTISSNNNNNNIRHINGSPQPNNTIRRVDPQNKMDTTLMSPAILPHLSNPSASMLRSTATSTSGSQK